MIKVKQSEIKYNRLIQKAKELFMELGYKAVSMEEIAEAAGISKMTIYKYFPSKEKLFIEIMLMHIDKHYLLLEEELSQVKGTMEKINYLLDYSIRVSKNYSLALYNDVLSLPYLGEIIIAEKNKLNSLLFENILKEGVKKGEVRNTDIGFLANMLIIITEAYGKIYLSKIESREELEAKSLALFDFLKYGLFGGVEVE